MHLLAAAAPFSCPEARLKGRARGALVCTIFGAAWMLWSAAFVKNERIAALSSVTAIAVLVIGWAAVRLRVARRHKDSIADRERWASIAPLYWVNTAAEWLLSAGAVVVLAHYRRYSLIPQFLGVIIGLHFVVLAKVLGEPKYYVMGTVMILCVLVSLLIPDGSVRNIIACAGIGLPLWMTAVVILCET